MFNRILALILLVSLLSCGGSDSTTTMTGEGSVFDIELAERLAGEPVTVAGVRFTPATDWTDKGASGMRNAEFSFGPVEGDREAATMAVFYFGPTSGGDVKSNIARWVGQVTQPDGSSSEDAAIQKEFMVNEMPISTVELAGTYAATMGGPMSGKTVNKEDYRMYGAVVQGPHGNVFFKLTGPDKTAAEMGKTFAHMIHTVEVSLTGTH